MLCHRVVLRVSNTGNKTKLTEIYNEVAKNMIELPAMDDHITSIKEGTFERHGKPKSARGHSS